MQEFGGRVHFTDARIRGQRLAERGSSGVWAGCARNRRGISTTQPTTTGRSTRVPVCLLSPAPLPCRLRRRAASQRPTGSSVCYRCVPCTSLRRETNCELPSALVVPLHSSPTLDSTTVYYCRAQAIAGAISLHLPQPVLPPLPALFTSFLAPAFHLSSATLPLPPSPHPHRTARVKSVALPAVKCRRAPSSPACPRCHCHSLPTDPRRRRL